MVFTNHNWNWFADGFGIFALACRFKNSVPQSIYFFHKEYKCDLTNSARHCIQWKCTETRHSFGFLICQVSVNNSDCFSTKTAATAGRQLLEKARKWNSFCLHFSFKHKDLHAVCSPGYSVCVCLSYLQRSRWHRQEAQLSLSADGAQSGPAHHLVQLFELQTMNEMSEKWIKF